MDGLVLLELFQLAVMAGGAGGGDVAGEGDLQRGVGIGVALETIVQAEMGDPLVAAATGRDHILIPGRVAHMALLAGELVAVGHAIRLQGGDDARVALDAIRQGQRCGRRRWGRVADGLSGGVGAGLEDEEHGEEQAKIFGCKYYLAYYYRYDTVS